MHEHDVVTPLEPPPSRPDGTLVGLGLVFGAGAGSVLGLILAGGTGLALGGAFGGGLGIVAGAVIELLTTRRDRRAGH